MMHGTKEVLLQHPPKDSSKRVALLAAGGSLAVAGGLFGILVATKVIEFGSSSETPTPQPSPTNNEPANVQSFRGFHAGVVDEAVQDITSLDWKSSTTWKNPFQPGETEYLPAGVERFNIGAVKETVSSYFTKSIDEYQSSQASNWGINIAVPGMFSGGVKANTVRTHTFSQSDAQYYIESRLTYELYQDKLAPSAVSSVDLRAAVQMLPPLTDASAPVLVNRKNLSIRKPMLLQDPLYVYFDFFNKFGTHYVSQVTWGGMKWSSSMVSQSIVSSGDVAESNLSMFANYKIELDQQVKKNLSVGGDASWSQETKEQWNKFNQNCQTVFEATTVGGDPVLANHTDWLRSVPRVPMVISRKLTPYSSAVQRFDPGRANDIASAMEKYFTVCQADSQNRVCSGHGSCLFNELANPKRCVCDAGWQGAACNVRPDDLSLYPKKNTQTSAVLASSGTLAKSNPVEWSNFYIGLAPSASVSPDSMTGWKTTSMWAYTGVSSACNFLYLDKCECSVNFDFVVQYGGKVDGVATSFMQVALANVETVYDNGRSYWNSAVTAKLRSNGFYQTGNNLVAAIVEVKITAQYCDSVGLCDDQNSFYDSYEVRSDGIVRKLSSSLHGARIRFP